MAKCGRLKGNNSVHPYTTQNVLITEIDTEMYSTLVVQLTHLKNSYCAHFLGSHFDIHVQVRWVVPCLLHEVEGRVPLSSISCSITASLTSLFMFIFVFMINTGSLSLRRSQQIAEVNRSHSSCSCCACCASMAFFMLFIFSRSINKSSSSRTWRWDDLCLTFITFFAGGFSVIASVEVDGCVVVGVSVSLHEFAPPSRKQNNCTSR